MGKTESKILEVNNIYFEKSNRFSKDTSHNKYSLASNLTIFSSSLNIVKSSKNNTDRPCYQAGSFDRLTILN